MHFIHNPEYRPSPISDCRKLARKFVREIDFDDLVRLDDTTCTFIFRAFGCKVSFPAWGNRVFMENPHVQRLIGTLDLNLLTIDARLEVESAVAHYDKEQMDFNWRVDCLTDPTEFPMTSRQIKRYLFENLRTWFEADIAMRIFEARAGIDASLPSKPNVRAVNRVQQH
jgi:hypothetical protein